MKDEKLYNTKYILYNKYKINHIHIKVHDKDQTISIKHNS